MASGVVTEVETLDDLENNLDLAGSRLVCVYFTAPWCGPCKLTGKTLDQVAAEEREVMFLKVDAGELEEAGLKYEIEVMPTFCFIRNKIKLEDYIGGKLDTFRDVIDRLKSAPAPPAFNN